MNILKDNGINWKQRRLIRRLYQEQKIVVRLGKKMTKEIKIGKGVRQGCCTFPKLFNIYLEVIMSVLMSKS